MLNLKNKEFRSSMLQERSLNIEVKNKRLVKKKEI